jgi:hypothetical protein
MSDFDFGQSFTKFSNFFGCSANSCASQTGIVTILKRFVDMQM